MKYAAQWKKRMLSLLLGVMMLLCSFAVPVMAQEDWTALVVTLSWTDLSGNYMSVTATPVEGSDQTFWATVTASDVFSGLTLNVYHPYHTDYVFNPADGTIISAMDTGADMDASKAIAIMAYEADGVTVADMYTLYVSTQVAPVVVPTEAPTEVPTEVPTDTPEPVPATVDVQVIYQGTDGAYLGETTATLNTNANNTVYAADIDGYTPQTYQQDVYVDAAGNPAMNPVIFTYTAVETPTPAPTETEIIVIYNTADGSNLGSTSVMAPVGQTTTIPAAGFDGYNPDANEKYVTVDASGNPDQNPVIFTYTAAETPVPVPESVTVDVQCVTAGGLMIYTTQVTCLTGESMPVEAPALDGYTADTAAQTLTVSETGVADPAVLVFTYTAVVPETEVPVTEVPVTEVPVTETPAAEIRVTIRYVDESDMHDVASAQTSDVLTEGPNNITAAPADLADGYSIVSEPNATVDVAGGVADPAEVVFYYRAAPVATDTPAPVAPATVTVYYQDTKGMNIASPETVSLEAGKTSVVAPQADHVPAGYKAYQADPVSVTVSADGVADRESVTFVYEEEVIETPIPVGETINRFGTVNDRQVKFRSEPSTASKKTILGTLSKGTKVWMVKEQVTDAGENWTSVIYNGTSGYIMSKYLTVMTEAESQQYEAEECETPVPREPVVTEEPTATPEITATPTAPVITDAPTDTPTAVPSEVSVTVQFISTEGTLLGETRATCSTGMQTYVYAAAIEGYTPDSSAKVVTVDAAGTPDQNPVVFTYTKNPVVTETPVVTQTPYTGYAVTTGTVALRTEISTADASIITTLPAETLINVTAQSTDSASGSVWSRGTTLANQQGYVPDSMLRHINAQEAEYYIRKWNDETATPTPTPVTTSEPPQVVGYAYTVGDGVYFRSQASVQSQIINVLGQNIPMLVMGQVYDANNVAWHIVNYNGVYGYIRADMLRMMTAQEVIDYTENLKKGTPTPVPSSTPQPYDDTSLSSYGYVTTTSVNFRQSASTSSKKVGTLKQYAFCLILGTEQVNGVTWYRVSYNGTTGYIMGNYFKQMTIEEVQTFLNSAEYKKGISNNTSGSSSSSSSSTTVKPAEDSTVDEWKSNSSMNVSYEPFNPFSTPEPLATTAAPTASATVSPSVSPTTSDLPNPMATTEEPVATIEINDPDDTNSGSNIVLIIGVGLAVLCIAAGVIGYVVYSRDKKRMVQQRAAAKRAAAQRGTAPQGQQPRQGYPQGSQQRGTATQAQNPYARNAQATRANASSSTYRRPEVKAAPDVTGMRSSTNGDGSAQQQRTQSAPYGQSSQQRYTGSTGNTGSGQSYSGTRQQGMTGTTGSQSYSGNSTSQPYTGSYRQGDGGESGQQYTASYRPTDEGANTSYTPRRRRTQASSEELKNQNQDQL